MSNNKLKTLKNNDSTWKVHLLYVGTLICNSKHQPFITPLSVQRRTAEYEYNKLHINRLAPLYRIEELRTAHIMAKRPVLLLRQLILMLRLDMYGFNQFFRLWQSRSFYSTREQVHQSINIDYYSNLILIIHLTRNQLPFYRYFESKYQHRTE